MCCDENPSQMPINPGADNCQTLTKKKKKTKAYP